MATSDRPDQPRRDFPSGPQPTWPPAHGDEPARIEPHADHARHLRSLFIVYFWLMVLLVLTVLAAEVPAFHLPGHWNIIVALTIAIVKATLVVLIFMHVLHAGRLIWVAAGAAFLWLAIMVGLTLNDYLTRHDIPRADPQAISSFEHRRTDQANRPPRD